MGHLRDRMDRDLKLAKFSPRTRYSYLNHVSRFARHFMRSPELLGDDDIREYLLFLITERNIGESNYRTALAAIKFLYRVTLKKPFEVEAIPHPKRATRLPNILSGTEVVALLGAVRVPKYKAILSTLYGSGLRISEACHLRIEHIDSRRGLINVVNGKGGADRSTVLPKKLLEQLRAWWTLERPKEFLFPGKGDRAHVEPDAVRTALRAALAQTQIKKHVTPHVLRHSFATHLLEIGVDITIIQAMLGHRLIATTTRYAQVRADLIGRSQNPFDILGTSAAAVLG